MSKCTIVTLYKHMNATRSLKLIHGNNNNVNSCARLHVYMDAPWLHCMCFNAYYMLIVLYGVILYSLVVPYTKFVCIVSSR